MSEQTPPPEEKPVKYDKLGRRHGGGRPRIDNPNKSDSSKPRGQRVRTAFIEHPYPQCGRMNSAGAPCGMPAGWGTPLLGKEGAACRKHSGGQRVGVGEKHPNFKHGLYSKVGIPEIQELAEQLSKDRDVFDFRDHIHLLEAMMLHALNKQQFEASAKVGIEITKAIQRLHEIEEGRKYVIHLNDVNVIIEKVAEIVFRHIPDPYTRSLVARELRNVNVITTPTTQQALPAHEDE